MLINKYSIFYFLFFFFQFCFAQNAEINYPSKPIRIVIPQSSGSATDTLIRIIAPKLSENLGVPLILDNRLGAGGIIGADAVAKSVPDGYTLLVGATSWITIAPYVYTSLSYEPQRDFLPISIFAIGQNVLSVPTSSPHNSVKELVSAMRDAPSAINMASAGIGSTSHMAGILLTSMSGVSAVHVPYKGAGPSVMSLLSGESQWVFTPMQGPISLIKAGKLRPLAVGGQVRSAILPNVPTVKESGISGYDFKNWYGLLAPAGTPRLVIEKLNASIMKISRLPEIKDHFFSQGAEPSSNTSAEFTQFIREELEKMSQLVKISGLKAE